MNGIKVHFILNFYVVFQCVHDPVDLLIFLIKQGLVVLVVMKDKLFISFLNSPSHICTPVLVVQCCWILCFMDRKLPHL